MLKEWNLSTLTFYFKSIFVLILSSKIRLGQEDSILNPCLKPKVLYACLISLALATCPNHFTRVIFNLIILMVLSLVHKRRNLHAVEFVSIILEIPFPSASISNTSEVSLQFIS
jgi:ABC-type sulfate transport system permease component